MLLSGAIVLALSFSLATDNQIEYGLNNGTALSSKKGTELLWEFYTWKDNLNMEYLSLFTLVETTKEEISDKTPDTLCKSKYFFLSL